MGRAAARRRAEVVTGLGAASRLVRESLQTSHEGSPAERASATAARVDDGLLLLFLGARGIHLVQALVDVTIGRVGYAHPAAAVGGVLACLGESVLVAALLLARRRLVLSVLIVDAVFGLVLLGVLSFGTAGVVNRTGTIDWMLPYTVATGVGLGLLVARGDGWAEPRDRNDWRGAWPVAALMSGYTASVLLPRLGPGETIVQVLENALDYPAFYLAAAGASLALRRLMEIITSRNEAAQRAAAEVAEKAFRRAVAVDVFGPALDLIDRAAQMGDQVESPLREAARRLVVLIEAIRPQK